MLLSSRKEFAITIACYGVAMIALAYGVWIAGGPVSQPGPAGDGLTVAAPGCAGAACDVHRNGSTVAVSEGERA